jgi:hypothetical protein
MRAHDILAWLFRDLLLAANPLVQQRLSASATPEMQAEIRRPLRTSAADARNICPTTTTAQRTIGRRAKAGFDETHAVEFANKGQYVKPCRRWHRYAPCRPR